MYAGLIAATPVNSIWINANLEDIDLAVAAAEDARLAWAGLTHAERGDVLRALAARMRGQREGLARIASSETSLPLPRLDGEIERTAFQLEHFAEYIEHGEHLGIVIDEAVPGGPPAGHPDLRRMNIPLLGPVVVFAASNFPFAFSVLGGDTASALAAGCPVVLKGHPGHPRTSAAVAELAQQVFAELGLPTGVLSLVTCERTAAVALVAHPAVVAVAFTGSLAGGRALADVAAARPTPIPFFGELGSLNPFIVMPFAAEMASDEVAEALVNSITMGVGQFCTRPGLVLAPGSPAGERLVAAMATRLRSASSGAMLTQGILHSYSQRVSAFMQTGQVNVLAGAEVVSGMLPMPTLLTTSVEAFLSHTTLREEIFGPAVLVVRYGDLQQIEQCLAAVAGTLTLTFCARDGDDVSVKQLLPKATSIAGRVLFEGVPTGVAVAYAQTHGGPYPASTRPESTSVGFTAIHRFLRPVTFQDAPDHLLPQELCRDNPLRLARRVIASERVH